MKILITGAKGFIGCYLSEKLKTLGHEVFEHTSQDSDIRDRDSLKQYAGIQHVFHLAAKIFVPESWENAQLYYDINIMGTITVLEFCRHMNVSLTFLSTYMYGEPKYLPIDELHPVACISPYHESKKICEDLCQFYYENHGVHVTILRPFNIFGKGQNDNYLLPKLYKQITDPSFYNIHVMDLDPKRDYIYIQDFVEMLVMTVGIKQGFHIYNAGSGKSYSVKEVIRVMMDVIGITKPFFSDQAKRKNEVNDCIANIKKFENEVGNIRLHTLQEGIYLWHQEESKRDDK